MLNNREIASLFWFGILSFWVLTKPELRSSFTGLLSHFREPKVLIPFLGLVLWTSGLVWLGTRASIWDDTLIPDTVEWFFAVALVLLFNLNRASTEPHFLRRTLRNTIGIFALIQVFVNLFPLSLVWEIPMQPVLLFIVTGPIVARGNESLRPAADVLKQIEVIIGLGILIYAVTRLVRDWSELDLTHIGQVAALGGWLTIGILPYIYLMSLYSDYEVIFLQIDRFTSDRHRRWRSRLAIALFLPTHLRGSFRWHPIREVTEAESLWAARRPIRDFAQNQR